MQDARDEGFKILNVEDSWRVPGSICVFLASFDSTTCVYEQFAVISKLPRLGAKVLKVIMPFFPSLTLRGEGGERGSGHMGKSAGALLNLTYTGLVLVALCLLPCGSADHLYTPKLACAVYRGNPSFTNAGSAAVGHSERKSRAHRAGDVRCTPPAGAILFRR